MSKVYREIRKRMFRGEQYMSIPEFLHEEGMDVKV